MCWSVLFWSVLLLGLLMGFPPRRKAPQSSGQLKQLVQLQAPTSAYHPYQTVHRNGISNEQTVVMMYDNLTQNEVNLKPGITENKWKSSPNTKKNLRWLPESLEKCCSRPHVWILGGEKRDDLRGLHSVVGGKVILEVGQTFGPLTFQISLFRILLKGGRVGFKALKLWVKLCFVQVIVEQNPQLYTLVCKYFS